MRRGPLGQSDKMAVREALVQVIPSGLARSRPSPHTRVQALQPVAPHWVRALFDPDASSGERLDGVHLDVNRRGELVLVSARVDGAIRMTADELSAQVQARYTALATLLARLDHHAIRYWNYVPDIVGPVGPGLDRYMAFNRGRHAALVAAGRVDPFPHPATASAVGITSPDLVIHCLAARAAGTPVENPRQVASWRYSRRYGPQPPCFARGTLARIDGVPLLLIGGTASIVGETSQHLGDRDAQLLEIFRNLEALIETVADRRSTLRSLSDVRIYVVRPEDAGHVAAAVRERAGETVRVETAVARVCRPELLIEIEAVARLSPA